MKANCFQFSEDNQLQSCEYSIAIEGIKNQSTRVWIDLMDTTGNELQEVLDDIKVKGLIRRMCLDSRDHPGYYPMKPIALMVIPVQMEVQDSNVMEYLALLISKNYLISIRNSRMARFQKSINSQDSLDLLPDNNITGLISSLLLGLSLDSLRKATKLSDKILLLEEQMDHESSSVKIEEISDKRSELLTMESIVQGQLPIIEAIIPSNKNTDISGRSEEYLIWAAANLKSTDRKLEWLEHRIEVMRSLIDMKAQEKINRRLRRLTVLSMIFMPITFLAGIWGMNFEFMPGLKWEYGYFIALGIMLLTIVGMYLNFRKKGWFK